MLFNEEKPFEKSGTIKTLEWIGNIFSLVYFATPLIQIIELYKGGQDKRENIPLFLLLTILFNCLFWLIQAFSSDDLGEWIPLLCSNISGLVINVTILFLYLYLLLNKKIKQFILYGVFVVNLLIEITYLMFRYLINTEQKEDKTDTKYQTFHLVGFIATVINVLMYSSPASNLSKLFKTGEYSALPIFTLLAGFFTTLIFIINGLVSYNYYIGEVNANNKNNALETIVSNVISFLIVSVQIGIWVYFYLQKLKNQGNNETKRKVSDSEKDERIYSPTENENSEETDKN